LISIHKKNTKFFLGLIFGSVFLSCFPSKYQSLSAKDPNGLLMIKDSLIQKYGKNENLIISIANAHNSLGVLSMKEKNYDIALNHFSESLSILPDDSITKYNKLMAEGHLLFERGNQNSLWDAIKKYSQATQENSVSGEPYYYMGLAYRKLGDKDFDLIIESFNNALKRTLSSQQRVIIENEKKQVSNREKKLKDFWK
tara:strand:+ start:1287 stop:1880 length:594 start_codon:yes stop_codon:yes gene_type:complete